MSRQSVKQSHGRRSGSALWVILILVALALVFFFIRSQQSSVEVRPVPGQTNEPQTQVRSVQSSPAELHLPKDHDIVRHRGYALSYSEEHEQAAWVAYVLRGWQMASGSVSRTNNFMADPLVKSGTAGDEDYEGSGYDRGHLAPAEDMSWSNKTMRESFYYSNMSPQVPAFNRGVWKRLEDLVRYWENAYDSIYVVTGPILTNKLPTIGPEQVSVPKYYYKVVLRNTPEGGQGIGFILENKASSATLKKFAVSIDEVEQRTGIDFFPRLDDGEEARVEGAFNEQEWNWRRQDGRQ